MLQFVLNSQDRMYKKRYYLLPRKELDMTELMNPLGIRHAIKWYNSARRWKGILN